MLKCWPTVLSGHVVGQSFCWTLGNDMRDVRSSSASLATNPCAIKSVVNAVVMIGGMLASYARDSMVGKPYQNSSFVGASVGVAPDLAFLGVASLEVGVVRLLEVRLSSISNSISVDCNVPAILRVI